MQMITGFFSYSIKVIIYSFLKVTIYIPLYECLRILQEYAMFLEYLYEHYIHEVELLNLKTLHALLLFYNDLHQKVIPLK